MATFSVDETLPNTFQPIDCQFRDAARMLHRLADAVRSREPIRKLLKESEAALAALPLAPNDFVVARCRIRHAKRLLWHGELKTASEELRLVADCLFVHPAYSDH